MRVSVLVSDQMIVIDGQPHECKFVAPDGLRAIQFADEICECEWIDKPNTQENAEFLQPFLDAWMAANDAHKKRIEEIDVQVYELRNSWDAKRRKEYPPIADYLDGLVKGDQAQIDAYFAACLAVKLKYPKPTA